MGDRSQTSRLGTEKSRADELEGTLRERESAATWGGGTSSLSSPPWTLAGGLLARDAAGETSIGLSTRAELSRFCTLEDSEVDVPAAVLSAFALALCAGLAPRALPVQGLIH